MKRYLTAVAFALVGTFTMTAQAQTPTLKKETLKVELMVFSGRANPTFTITDESEIQEILNLVKNLPQKKLKEGETGLPPSKLGYQGFTVTNNTKTSPEIKSFVVNGSAVLLDSPSTAGTPAARGGVAEYAARADSSASLESKLLSHAKETGIASEEMLDAIQGSK